MTLIERLEALSGPDQFTPHFGGDCPVSGDEPVEIIVSGGERSKWDKASSVLWRWDSYVNEISALLPSGCRVIGYRALRAWNSRKAEHD